MSSTNNIIIKLQAGYIYLKSVQNYEEEFIELVKSSTPVSTKHEIEWVIIRSLLN